MPNRKGILIIEEDDFLREILGNLLHKKGYYIVSDFCIEKSLEMIQHHRVDLVILGTSCEQFKDKHTLRYIEERLGQKIPFFLIVHKEEKVSYLPESQQILEKEISLKRIFQQVEKLL